MMAFCFIARTAFFSPHLRYTGLKPAPCPAAACKVFGLELVQETVFLVLFLPTPPGMPPVPCTHVRRGFQSRCWDRSLNSQVVTQQLHTDFLAC